MTELSKVYALLYTAKEAAIFESEKSTQREGIPAQTRFPPGVPPVYDWVWYGMYRTYIQVETMAK